MKLPIGDRDLEWGGPDLGELRDANDLLGDLEALRARMGEDGYLLLRGLHDRDTVLQARRAIVQCIDAQGALKPGTDPLDAVIRPGARHPATMGKRPITHAPAVRAVLEGKPIFDFFEHYFGGPVRTFDYKWLRAVETESFTGAHYDVVYMGRGSKNLVTCWTPFGDIPLEQGTLAICVGSHSLPGFEKLRRTYGRMDVDRDRVAGWFSSDPLEITSKFGGRWHTTNFRAGDVLILTMFTMHGSTRNQTDRWRLSCDTRFQPAADPVDERWVGENPLAHYAWHAEPEKTVSMEEARARWGV